jgi:hypothetical protein
MKMTEDEAIKYYEAKEKQFYINQGLAKWMHWAGNTKFGIFLCLILFFGVAFVQFFTEDLPINEANWVLVIVWFLTWGPLLYCQAFIKKHLDKKYDNPMKETTGTTKTDPEAKKSR